MADFNEAYKGTMRHEGGYSDDSTDAGGETYKGVSRRFHPSWIGWFIIDKIKDLAAQNDVPLNVILDQNDAIQNAVKSFYKASFWDRFNGDNIPDQAIAEELFDTSVNMGVHRAVVFLQRALNLLNRNQKNYSDILEDGIFGNDTLKTLGIYLGLDGNPNYLLKIANTLQGMHYIDYMTKHPEQEKYARGWFNRTQC